MSESDKAWVRNPGALAWAILPPAAITELLASSSTSSSPITKTTNKNINNKSNGIKYYWPVILYPSWSYAAKDSGLISNISNRNSPRKHDGGSQTTQRVSFIGCKTSVTLDQLKKNMVPKRVALGSSSVKGQALRPKVVAYFLGLSTMSSSWSAVHIRDVKLYSMENCRDVLSEYSTFSQRIKSNDCEKQEFELIWTFFMLAMEEASIVCEQKVYNPRYLMKHFKASARYHQSRSELKNDKKSYDNKYATKHREKNNSDCDEKFVEELTPECFSDWRADGNTQKNGDSQHSQFVFTGGTVA